MEEFVIKIKERNLSEITLSTGKTPSGHIHIGILREIIICDALRRIFEKENKKVNFYLFLDSLDAAKRFPEYIDANYQKQHIGKPFALIPCPFKDCGCESYAHHFGNELISTFSAFGIKNRIIWTHELYKTKEMMKNIKLALEKNDEIKDILKKYILPTLDDAQKNEFIEMQKAWMPVMAICEKCGKIQSRDKDGSIKPNRVLSYNSEKESVVYQCSSCGFNSELSIYSGKLKLNWRIDWPAKWSMFNTTCEPAGKDHCVKGGAYDTGLELSQKIFGYIGPIRIPYEWLRLGEFDMKTSKGIVFTPKRYLEIADAGIFRMLILKTNNMKHISLRVEEIPQYYDAFDRMKSIFLKEIKSESKEEEESVNYIFPLIKVEDTTIEKSQKRLPLKLLMFLSQIQNILSLEKLYQKAKIMAIGNTEDFISINEFNDQLKKTKNWIDEVKKVVENEKDIKIKQNILQKINIFEIPKKLEENLLNKLSKEQLKGISLLRAYIEHEKALDENSIQNKIFSIAKEDLKISPTKMFEAIYLIILGKKNGPKLGPFLILLDKEWILERLLINN